MRDFVEGNSCRHRTICQYFGEVPKWDNCGACDICGVSFDWLDAKEPAAIRVAKIAEKDVEDPRSRELREYLRQWRAGQARDLKQPAFAILHDSTIDDLVRREPRNQTELLQVFGIGGRKAATWGAQILEALEAFQSGARATPQKLESLPRISPGEETLTLLNQGKSIQEIADIRSRRLETVYSTICILVEQGKVDWQDSWMPAARRKAIEEAAHQQGFERAKPIKEVLPEDVTYDEIRLVLADLKRPSGAR